VVGLLFEADLEFSLETRELDGELIAGFRGFEGSGS